jgi:hypothetical protein
MQNYELCMVPPNLRVKKVEELHAYRLYSKLPLHPLSTFSFDWQAISATQRVETRRERYGGGHIPAIVAEWGREVTAN